MKIHQNDLGDILKFLPDETELDYQIESDFIICTLGFEDRTYAVLEKLISFKSNNHRNLILISYPTNKDDNNINRPHFEEVKLKGISVFEIEYQKGTFYNTISTFFNSNVGMNSKVIFDISTCSSYLFYPIIKALLALDVQLLVAYTAAENYDPTEEEWLKVADKAKKENQLFVKSWDEADFQSVGVDDVYSSNLFCEMNPGNKPAILIAIPNFNSIRMQSIKEKDREINKTDSKDTIWLIGKPPSDQKKWRIEALLKTNTLESISENNKWYVSTLHYKDTIKQLEAIWTINKYTTHISIGTLGSKMQHLATFFFIYLHPDVGLWLAEPRQFRAKSYSAGKGDMYQIDFGSTKKLRNHLSNYMQFAYVF